VVIFVLISKEVQGVALCSPQNVTELAIKIALFSLVFNFWIRIQKKSPKKCNIHILPTFTHSFIGIIFTATPTKYVPIHVLFPFCFAVYIPGKSSIFINVGPTLLSQNRPSTKNEYCKIIQDPLSKMTEKDHPLKMPLTKLNDRQNIAWAWVYHNYFSDTLATLCVSSLTHLVRSATCDASFIFWGNPHY